MLEVVTLADQTKTTATMQSVNFVFWVPKQPNKRSYSKQPPKLSYLQKRLSLSDKQLVRLVTKSPPILCSSIDANLEPKIELIEGLIGLDEVKKSLMQGSSILGVSIEKRLKPRLAKVQEAGIPTDSSGTLSRMAIYTEEHWSTSVEYQKKRLRRGKLW